MTKTSASGKEDNFERSLKRLQQIVETLEEGSVNLDEVMKMYEEGVHLSKSCLAQLHQVEVKLKRLGKDIEGNFKLTDETLEE